ncbi:MAG: DNRLRE domain-containing protein [Solirubrobacteraceae bacterium]|nr:DNRLRE domain-containing protein [Solirubrobacteraceae bacterium]
MRTERGRTYRRSDGSLQTRISLGAVNYRDGSGDWKPIDNTLKDRGGALENGGGTLQVRIPKELAQGDVRVGHDDAWVAFRLQGAGGDAKVSGSLATFDNALPNVRVAYRADGDALKESLTLASPAAGDTFSFRVKASQGLTPEPIGSGEIVFREGSGKRAFTLAAPWMKDAGGEVSQAVRYELTEAPGGWTVQVVADRTWLDSPDRRFPVVIDPTTYIGPGTTCELASGSLADTKKCTTAAMPVSVGRENGRVHRALVDFDLAEMAAVMPADSVIMTSDFFFTWNTATPADVELEAYPLTRAYTANATWNKFDGTTAWTLAGGDMGARETKRKLYSAWAGGWAGLGIGRLAQGWLDGSTANRGLLVKAANETLNRMDNLDGLGIVIDWRPRTGNEPQASFETIQPTPTTKVQVNVGNGNLVMNEQDVSLAASAGTLNLSRTFNTAGDLASSRFGPGWTADKGAETTLSRYWVDGAYIFEGAGGLHGRFSQKADGTYQAPPGWNATLTEGPDGTVTVVFGATGEEWKFDSSDPHRLVKITRTGGYAMNLLYGSNGLSQITDTTGRHLDYTYNASGDLTGISNGTNEATYQHDADHLLSGASAMGKTEATTYVYDDHGRVTRVDYPGAISIEVAYDSLKRVSKVTYGPDTVAAHDQTTAFAYSAPTSPCVSTDLGKTVVTYPQGTTRTYCYDRTDKVRTASPTVGTDVTPPTFALTGELWDDRGTSLETDSSAVHVTATDPNSGVKSIELKIDGTRKDFSTQACTPGGCTLDRDYAAALATVPDGDHTVTVVATDQAGTTAQRSWTVETDSSVQPGPTPTTPTYTALLLATSHHCSGSGACWTTEDAMRNEYNRYSTAGSKVQPAIRTVNPDKDDVAMLTWERLGFKYFYTAASSDFRQDTSQPLYVPEASATEVLGRTNNLGLYMHEVISYNAAVNGWKWKEAAASVDWALIDRWVSAARAAGKKVIWSEPSHGWVAVLNSGAGRYYFKKWGNAVVPMYATNFPDQINSFSKPGATELAAAYGGSLGVSVQSWFFRDQSQAPSINGTFDLAKAGYDAGARYFQIEGAQTDLAQFGAATPTCTTSDTSGCYLVGVRSFLSSLQTAAAKTPQGTNASRVPLYHYYGHKTGTTLVNDHYYSRGATAPAGYSGGDIVGYVYNVKAPGSVPLYEMYSAKMTDHYYSTSDANMQQAYCDSFLAYRWRSQSGATCGSWSADRTSADIVGYVMPDSYGETVSLKELWNPGTTADPGSGAHYYTANDWLASKFQGSGYPAAPYVVGYLFDNNGQQTELPVAQMWENTSLVDHFYTAVAGEVVQYGGMGYALQGYAGRIRTEPVAGAIPLYEAYSAISKDHFYTIDPFQLYASVDSWMQYTNIRVIGYVPPGPQGAATLPFWQLWNPGTAQNPWWADHFYTTDAGQRSNAMANGYADQGTAGYLAPEAYPTSAQFGGGNGAIENEEAAAVADAFNAAASDAAARALLNGLRPADVAIVESAIRAKIRDGDFVRNIDNGRVEVFRDGQRNWVPSTAIAEDAGIDLGLAKRVTAGVTNAWTAGPDVTGDWEGDLEGYGPGSVFSAINSDYATNGWTSKLPHIEETDADDTQATLRQKPLGHTIGSLLPGDKFDVQDQAHSHDGGHGDQYYWGYAWGGKDGFRGCAWVDARAVDEPSPPKKIKKRVNCGPGKSHTQDNVSSRVPAEWTAPDGDGYPAKTWWNLSGGDDRYDDRLKQNGGNGPRHTRPSKIVCEDAHIYVNYRKRKGAWRLLRDSGYELENGELVGARYRAGSGPGSPRQDTDVYMVYKNISAKKKLGFWGFVSAACVRPVFGSNSPDYTQ